jgi:protein TonB
MAFSVTAQIDLERRRSTFVGRAVVASVVMHALVFVISPPFSFKPYQLEQAGEMTLVEPPPDFVLPPPPKDPPPPELRIIFHDTDEELDAPFPGTSPEDFKDLPVPPPPLTDRTEKEFIAFDQPPVMIHFEAPVYPKLARQAGFEGRVSVIVLIGEDGKVIEAKTVSSEVSPAMEQAALEAAGRCRFKPAKQRTQPVRARVVIPFEFRLN